MRVVHYLPGVWGSGRFFVVEHEGECTWEKTGPCRVYEEPGTKVQTYRIEEELDMCAKSCHCDGHGQARE